MHPRYLMEDIIVYRIVYPRYLMEDVNVYCIVQNSGREKFGKLVILKFWQGKLWWMRANYLSFLILQANYLYICDNSKPLRTLSTENMCIVMNHITFQIVNHDLVHHWTLTILVSSASAKGWRYFKIYIFRPKFAAQVSTHACVKFLSGSQEFYKKLGWVKW